MLKIKMCEWWDNMKRFCQWFMNLVVIIVYAVGLYFFYQFIYYGLHATIIDILLLIGCVLCVMIWFIVSAIKTYQHQEVKNHKIWKIGTVIFIIITCIDGYFSIGLVHDRITHKNLENVDELRYTLDIDGSAYNVRQGDLGKFVEDICSQLYLNEQLNVNDKFEVQCLYDGAIKSLDLSLITIKNNDVFCYDISYQQLGKVVVDYKRKPLSNETSDISVDAMIKTLNVIQLKPCQNDFTIVYSKDYVSKSENVISYRFNQQHYIVVSYAINDAIEPSQLVISPHEDENMITTNDEDHMCWLDDQTAFGVRVTDAAAGSYLYSLEKTTDGGKTWTTINPDPLSQTSGGSCEVFFIDENVGFMMLTRQGGEYSQLFRTSDGGKSFERVEFDSGDFDYIHLPYMKEGQLYVQLSEMVFNDSGEYDVYQSSDQGKSWTIIEKKRVSH